MPIPSTMSATIDPGEPSLLTSIPPELRNIIYEILFKRDGPVLLHNAKAYHAIKPKRGDCISDEDYQELLDVFYDEYDREIDARCDFDHDFQESISLLLCCRQVYHEAVGVLYSKNSFIVSRGPNRHDTGTEDISNGHIGVDHNFADYFQFTYAPRWVSALGSQLNLLREVVIDVDCMCPKDCDLQNIGVDLLSILRLLWKFPEMIKVVTVGHSGRGLIDHPVSRARFYIRDRKDVDVADILNNLLLSIGTKDMLNIKRYGCHDRLLHSVSICNYEEGYSRGNVFFKEGNQKFTGGLKFTILDDGRVVQLVEEERQPLLFEKLPCHVLRQIYQFAQPNCDEIIFDLTTRKSYGFNWSFLHINHNLRNGRASWACVLRTNVVVFRMTSTEPSTDFEQFYLWQNLSKKCVLRLDIFHCLLKGSDDTSKPLIISMEFVLPTPKALSELRINIRELVFSCGRFQFGASSPNIVLRFRINDPRSPGRLIEEMSVPLAKLQKELFLLLSDIKKDYGNVPLGDIGINGCGKLLYAEIVTMSEAFTKSTKTCAFRYGKLTNAEVYQKGCSMASKLNKQTIRNWNDPNGPRGGFYHQGVSGTIYMTYII